MSPTHGEPLHAPFHTRFYSDGDSHPSCPLVAEPKHRLRSRDDASGIAALP